MKDAVLYIHGKGGSAAECEHYRPLFPDFEVIGLDPQRLPEKLQGNLYKCGDKTAWPHFLSWAPIGTPAPDFHCPAYFGEFLLG